MARFKKYVARYIYTIFVMIFILSSAVFAFNNTKNIETFTTSELTEKELISELKQEFHISGEKIEQLQEEHGQVGKVAFDLVMQKYSEMLTDKKVADLHKQGYSIQDIYKAAEYSAAFNRSIEEVLSAKGKEERYEVKKVKKDNGEEEEIVIDHNEELWDKAIKKLGVDLGKQSQKLGATADKLAVMKKKGTGTRQTFDMAFLAQKYDKPLEEVMEKVEMGQTLPELERLYSNEATRETPSVPAAEPELSDEEKAEKVLRTTLQITEEEIEAFKNKGMDKITDIAMSKHLSAKYKTEIENIIKLKKEKIHWQEVEKALGVNG